MPLRCRVVHIKECRPSNQAHPIPKSAHVPIKRMSPRRTQSKSVAARGALAIGTLCVPQKHCACIPAKDGVHAHRGAMHFDLVGFALRVLRSVLPIPLLTPCCAPHSHSTGAVSSQIYKIIPQNREGTEEKKEKVTEGQTENREA